MPSDSRGLVELVDEHFIRVPGYLATASVGLPPRASIAALNTRLSEWQAGASLPPSFDPDVRRARTAFAQIVGAEPESIAIAPNVSTVAGMVAASLPDNAVVLCAEEDFTSVLFPFLSRGLDVKVVALDRLLDSVNDDIDLVAVSAVQSSSGQVLDLDALSELASRHSVRSFVDVTQAAGWLPVEAGRFDVTACHGYKWLCSPRGAGFATVREDAVEWLQPTSAGWYAGEEPWSSIYGPPLRLARGARRFDTSPVWFSYAAAAPTLELLSGFDIEHVHSYSVGLANRFCELVGVPAANSAIVSVSLDDHSALSAAGVKASARAGRARFSFYIYNTDDDVARAAEAVLAGIR